MIAGLTLRRCLAGGLLETLRRCGDDLRFGGGVRGRIGGVFDRRIGERFFSGVLDLDLRFLIGLDRCRRSSSRRRDSRLSSTSRRFLAGDGLFLRLGDFLLSSFVRFLSRSRLVDRDLERFLSRSRFSDPRSLSSLSDLLSCTGVDIDGVGEGVIGGVKITESRSE